jgi:hypothetical protein
MNIRFLVLGIVIVVVFAVFAALVPVAVNTAMFFSLSVLVGFEPTAFVIPILCDWI